MVLCDEWARGGDAGCSVAGDAFGFFSLRCAWRRRQLPLFLIFAFAVVLAVEGEGVAARDLAVAFRLLTSPAVERAEHRSGTRGEEAHVSERSELCAVPSLREERRAPMRRSRIGSRPAVLSFGYLFFARAKKSNSLPVRGAKALDPASALFPCEESQSQCNFKNKANA